MNIKDEILNLLFIILGIALWFKYVKRLNIRQVTMTVTENRKKMQNEEEVMFIREKPKYLNL